MSFSGAKLTERSVCGRYLGLCQTGHKGDVWSNTCYMCHANGYVSVREKTLIWSDGFEGKGSKFLSHVPYTLLCAIVLFW